MVSMVHRPAMLSVTICFVGVVFVCIEIITLDAPMNVGVKKPVRPAQAHHALG